MSEITYHKLPKNIETLFNKNKIKNRFYITDFNQINKNGLTVLESVLNRRKLNITEEQMSYIINHTHPNNNIKELIDIWTFIQPKHITENIFKLFCEKFKSEITNNINESVLQFYLIKTKNNFPLFFEKFIFENSSSSFFSIKKIQTLSYLFANPNFKTNDLKINENYLYLYEKWNEENSKHKDYYFQNSTFKDSYLKFENLVYEYKTNNILEIVNKNKKDYKNLTHKI